MWADQKIIIFHLLQIPPQVIFIFKRIVSTVRLTSSPSEDSVDFSGYTPARRKDAFHESTSSWFSHDNSSCLKSWIMTIWIIYEFKYYYPVILRYLPCIHCGLRDWKVRTCVADSWNLVQGLAIWGHPMATCTSYHALLHLWTKKCFPRSIRTNNLGILLKDRTLKSVGLGSVHEL